MTEKNRAPWPQTVMLELTNACDLACRHCPFHGDGVEKQRSVQQMPEAVWGAILAEIAGWNTDVVLQPWGMGEPLLFPRLWELVRAAKQHPRITVGFYSNGNQWRQADACAAVATGLDWVCFSIDGTRQEVFERYRVGASLDRVLATVRDVAAARARSGGRRPRLRINMVQYPELEDHAEEFVASFRGLADSVMVSRFRRVGDRRFSPVSLPRVPCYQLDTLMAIAVDGRVVQCCEDQQGSTPLGWFPAQSLGGIWHGARLLDLRGAHRQGRFDACPLCADCDGWTGAFERRRRDGDVVVRERTAGTVYEFECEGQAGK